MEPTLTITSKPTNIFCSFKRTFKTTFADRMTCNPQNNEQNENHSNIGQSNKERKREMKFMAKQQQTMNSVQMASHDSIDCGTTTETEETDEDGTGNTGKPKPRCWWNETHPRNSDDAALFIEAARKMETLFDATLLTSEISKGRGGCDGLRF